MAAQQPARTSPELRARLHSARANVGITPRPGARPDFEAEWGDKYPSIAPSWRRAWQEVIPFFAFPPAVRKIIYTTNAIESLNRVIRKTTKTRGSFPTDAAATKLIYLAIRNFEKAGRCVREWVAARNQFAILYPERFNK